MIIGSDIRKFKEDFIEYFKEEIAINLPSRFKKNANDIIDHSHIASKLIACDRGYITDELLIILREILHYIVEDSHVKQLFDFNKDYFNLNAAAEIVEQQLIDNKAKKKIEIIFLGLKEFRGYEYELSYLCEDLRQILSCDIFFSIENVYAKKIQSLDEEGFTYGRKIDTDPYAHMSTAGYLDPLDVGPMYEKSGNEHMFKVSSLVDTPYASVDPLMNIFDNFDDEPEKPEEKEDRINKLEELLKSQQEIISKLENKIIYLESKYLADKLNDDLGEFVYENASEYFENLYKSWGEEIFFLDEENIKSIVEDSWKKFLNKIESLEGLNFNINDKDVINVAKETYIESFLFKISEKKGDLK